MLGRLSHVGFRVRAPPPMRVPDRGFTKATRPPLVAVYRKRERLAAIDRADADAAMGLITDAVK